MPWTVAWVLFGGAASGQVVEFRAGSGGLARADEVVRSVLARGDYVVLTADRVLSPGEVIDGDVIVLGATLRVEGTIRGDLVGVQSDIFARPGGEVGGTVVVLGGGFYGSTLARLARRPVSAAVYGYTYETTRGGGYAIVAPGGRVSLRPAGLYGLLLPEYDRVNALTIPLGLDFDRGGMSALPDAELRLRIRSAREMLDGALRLRWRTGRHAVSLAGGRTVRTNDGWINGDVDNSLYSFIGAVDTRNYYDADFVAAGIELGFGSNALWNAGLTLGWERARPLANEDPFSLFEVRAGGFQPNAPALAADAASLKLAGGVATERADGPGLTVQAELEIADDAVAGDLTFALLGGGFRLRLPTVGRQALVIEGRGQASLDDDAPPQRWRSLGGWGSLPTLVPTGQSGDRMWWTAATYQIPLSDRLGRLPSPFLWVQYGAGNAWTAGSRPSTVHDLGLGLTFGPLALALYTAPSDEFKTVFTVGFDPRH
ncbi:MAG: hypothetical protein GWN32_10010 [Gemmatimonadetes bacterium]|nr:hypothetical protein [Gemmatimonadota bacterium]